MRSAAGAWPEGAVEAAGLALLSTSGGMDGEGLAELPGKPEANQECGCSGSLEMEVIRAECKRDPVRGVSSPSANLPHNPSNPHPSLASPGLSVLYCDNFPW